MRELTQSDSKQIAGGLTLIPVPYPWNRFKPIDTPWPLLPPRKGIPMPKPVLL